MTKWGLREDDYPQEFLGFQLRVERIYEAVGHLYCTICGEW